MSPPTSTRKPPAAKKSRKSSSPSRIAAPPASDATRSFAVAAIGASAGGLEAVSELLENLPPELGIAYVLIQHLAPRHASALADILSKRTRMPVQEATHGLTVAPNHVYIIPPNRVMSIEGGRLLLLDREDHPSAIVPIDFFFRSLASDRKSGSIGIVLSGSSSDGALGLQAIKGEGGIAFAQDETAKYSAMPRSAINAGVVDFVLRPAAIATELARIARHDYVAVGTADRDGDPRVAKSEELSRILAILQLAHDVDFSQYKPSTIERRIRRRMALLKIDEMRDYVAALRAKPKEVEQLYHDLLIRVTGFFRDAEVFEQLEKTIFPEILRTQPSNAPVRIWVPGCATGEEVYSLAISFFEAAREVGHFTLQVFGTDVSEKSIAKAREGTYPENIALDVPVDRLRRYFTKLDGVYRISKAIRDSCVFARQNLTKEPPFSRIDLISCRNVLIYFDAHLQRRVMAVFHYALRARGHLVLGSSETVGRYADLFDVVDRRYKIFRKRSNVARPLVEFTRAGGTLPVTEGKAKEEPAVEVNIVKEAERILLSQYAPPGVIVNEHLQILHFRGHTGAFLEPSPGSATFDLLKMIKPALLVETRTAALRARKTDEPVRRLPVPLRHNGRALAVAVEIVPIRGTADERFFLVLFHQAEAPDDAGGVKPKPKGKRGRAEARQTDRLRLELEASREHLQSIIEEQEAMNEEFRSANEEIQSSNEELQSTNEELETAKEELQSTNEELTTLNEELENRNSELATLNNDLSNLLASIDIPIVMLGNDLRIRRFNPIAQRAFNIIASDVGRSISDLKLAVRIDDLEKIVVEVIDSLTTKELEVEDRGGRKQLMRIRPYRTIDNKIEGAVLALIDIDHLRKK